MCTYLCEPRQRHGATSFLAIDVESSSSKQMRQIFLLLPLLYFRSLLSPDTADDGGDWNESELIDDVVENRLLLFLLLFRDDGGGVFWSGACG